MLLIFFNHLLDVSIVLTLGDHRQKLNDRMVTTAMRAQVRR
jgi:hypothetical protein